MDTVGVKIAAVTDPALTADDHEGHRDERRSVVDLVDAVVRMSSWYWWWFAPWLPSRDTPPQPEPLTLPDGRQAWIRPILPSDRDLHAENYDRLSDESKYHRFLTSVPHLTEQQLDLLIDGVDGVDHIAFYLFLEDEDSPFPVAIGRIVRDPDRPDAADVAVTVQDEWHGQGIGTALLRELVARRPDGVTHLLTVVHWNNTGSRRMLRKIGSTREVSIGDGVVEVRVELTDQAAQAPSPERQDSPDRPLVLPWRHALHNRDRICDWFLPGHSLQSVRRDPDDAGDEPHPS